MLRVVGRNRHGPCEFPSSSIVIVRDLSTWLLVGAEHRHGHHHQLAEGAAVQAQQFDAGGHISSGA
jgi:hypothetical protein